MSDDGDPIHPILDRPWEYEILGFRFHREPGGWRDTYIDLTLARDQVIRRLRFLGPNDLEIARGGLTSWTVGMAIHDVRSRQMEDIGVCVTGVHGADSPVTFWAREVIDLDAEEASNICNQNMIL